MCHYLMEFKPTVNKFMNTGLMKLQVTYYVQAINTVKYNSTQELQLIELTGCGHHLTYCQSGIT